MLKVVKWEMICMKPRIFISSTFYDLKYIREDLANFVRSYGYEPILFEDGDIGYAPGKTLDSSCYESMRNSDMVILIIGGEYGSAASGEKEDEFKEYMSVTRNEFRTSVESGIPIFVVIDKKVMAEYGVYEANYNAIENENIEMSFPTTKNINVFRFIKEIKGIVTLPIQEFEKSSDIKDYISKQWADMFKNYLNSLRNEKEDKKLESSVNEMKTLIHKMDIMLNSVGKSVLANDDSNKYEEIINEQEIMMFCDRLVDYFNFCVHTEIQSEDKRKEIIVMVLSSLKKAQSIDEFSDMVCKGLQEYKLYQVKQNVLATIEIGVDILNDKRNFERIIDILSREDFFDRLIVY